jgi:hypothetical protein
MGSRDIPIGCHTPGHSFDDQVCCFPADQRQPECSPFIGPDPSAILLDEVCPSGNCLQDCRDSFALYNGVSEDDAINNAGSIRRYMACAAVPAIAGYEANGVLLPDQAELVRRFIPPDEATEENLRAVTATVTDCLAQTCLTGRNESLCYNQYCAPTRLLINATMPNQTAINQCLNTLCENGSQIVPYGNSDIIGIGVG